MPSELLQDRAALYVAGALSAPERETFELVLEFRPELRDQVARLQPVAAAVALAGVESPAVPPPALKSRILGAIGAKPCPPPAGLVVTGPAGLVEWANDPFLNMCGYSLADLRGRKPGELLQGPRTDADAIQRIRQAVRGCRPVREILLNYHQDGSVYRVEVAITPILDDDGAPLWFVAQERQLPLG
jgi:PAS domain S-box-containing protein